MEGKEHRGGGGRDMEDGNMAHKGGKGHTGGEKGIGEVKGHSRSGEAIVGQERALWEVTGCIYKGETDLRLAAWYKVINGFENFKRHCLMRYSVLDHAGIIINPCYNSLH